MTTEIPLELIPNLSAEKMNGAKRLLFSSTTGETEADMSVLTGSIARNISNLDVFILSASEGSTLSFMDISFFDPFLRIYDANGVAISTNSEDMDALLEPLMHDTLTSIGSTSYNFDLITSWRAPYSGNFYVNPGWDIGTFHDHYSLTITMDTDTSRGSIDKLFNFGEEVYPDLFPEHQDSQNYAELGYYARFYSNGFALGEKDGDVYMYDGSDIKLIGSANDLKHLLTESVDISA